MEAISAVRRTGSKPRQAARHTGNKREQGTLRTFGGTANGFLSHQFLPLYEATKKAPDRQVENSFFKSLNRLTTLHGFEAMDVSDKPYPYNLLLAHWDINQKLNTGNQEVELAIVQDDDGRTKLATKQNYNTGTVLYYIPVLPLYRLLQDKRNSKAADVLLSVFSYLYIVGGIPYYRDSDSATSYYYDMIREWVTDDVDGLDEEERNAQLSALNAADYYGDVMFRKMYNRKHLTDFKVRVANFIVADAFQKECLRVAKAALLLYQDFPERNIFKHINKIEQGYDDEIIRVEQYISFMADTKGTLYNTLSEMVNNEFNECTHMEEPAIEQVFDNDTFTLAEDLNFEHRFFTLIGDLCTLLYDMP